MIKDFFGNEINIGDYIVYATMPTNKPHLNVGRVLKIGDKKFQLEGIRLFRDGAKHEYLVSRLNESSSYVIKLNDFDLGVFTRGEEGVITKQDIEEGAKRELGRARDLGRYLTGE